VSPGAHVLDSITCLDHRVYPAVVLGLQLGDAPVIRNAGGRVTQAAIDDIAYLAFVAKQLFGGQGGCRRGGDRQIAAPPAYSEQLEGRARGPT
jgi:hypothetical protein